MKKCVIINEKEYATRFPNENSEYFTKLSEEGKKKYLELLSLYYNLVLNYLIIKFNLKKYDEYIENNELIFKIINESEMDIYQYLSSKKLSYFYLRNNFYIERLTLEEQKKLIVLSENDFSTINPEIEQFVLNTMKKVLIENEKDLRTNFGPDSIQFMAIDGSLIIGFRYDDYFISDNENDLLWNQKNNQREKEIHKIEAIINLEFKNKLPIPVRFIRYNDFSVKKKNIIIEKTNKTKDNESDIKIENKIINKEMNMNQANSELNNKYYKRESGGIIRLTNGIKVYSLTEDGNWVSNQYAYSMFVDGTVDYEEISETAVQTIIEERKKKVKMDRGMVL